MSLLEIALSFVLDVLAAVRHIVVDTHITDHVTLMFVLVSVVLQAV